MKEKDNEPPDWLQKLFSTQGILTAILILGVYWVFFGEDKTRDLDPDTIYFLTKILNELNLKKIRNEILSETLPLKV